MLEEAGLVGGGGPGESDEAVGEQLGALLFEQEGLPARELGELLTRAEPRYAAALAAFLARFDFGALSLPDALRLLFAALRCPGEAQKIDRLMQAFARSYFGDGHAPFRDADEVYAVAFSVMMLNVDQHNPSVRSKMSKLQFVTNTRRAASHVPADYLGSLYDAVAAEELKAHDEPPGRPPPGQPQPWQPPEAASPPAVSVWRWRYLRQRWRSAPSPRRLASARNGTTSRELDEAVAAPLLPVALDAAARHLWLCSADEGLRPAPLVDEEPDWQSAVRLLMLCLRASTPPSPGRPVGVAGGAGDAVDAVVRALCAGSRVAAPLLHESQGGRGDPYSDGPIRLVLAAFAVARALPEELGPAGWHSLVLTLLSLQQLGLCPAPLAPTQPVMGAADASRPDPDSVRRAGAIDAAVRLVEESLRAPGPPLNEPLWMRQRSCSMRLSAVQPSAVLSSAMAQLPRRGSSALLAALLRAVDDTVLLSLRNPHAGSLPASTALQLLGEALSSDSAAAREAIPAAMDRLRRVLATPACPLPVRHAASHSLASIRARQSQLEHRGVQ